jgi:hypothetical protein
MVLRGFRVVMLGRQLSARPTGVRVSGTIQMLRICTDTRACSRRYRFSSLASAQGPTVSPAGPCAEHILTHILLWVRMCPTVSPARLFMARLQAPTPVGPHSYPHPSVLHGCRLLDADAHKPPDSSSTHTTAVRKGSAPPPPLLIQVQIRHKPLIQVQIRHKPLIQAQIRRSTGNVLRGPPSLA